MAKDMLDAIYAAEEEFGRREDEAKTQSAQTVAQAKQDAKELIDRRVKKAEEDARAELDAARADGEKTLAQANAEAQTECEKISASAEKNRPAVIRKAAEAILK